jgi:hypothetical protein
MLEQFAGFDKGRSPYRSAHPAFSRVNDAFINGLFNQGGGGRLTPGNAFRAQVSDAALAGGQAFLEAELEKRDPKVREPLTSVTWPRDMVIKPGGGWVEFTSTFQVDYSTSGANGLSITGGQTTTIPIIQANLSKDIWRVWPWQAVLKVNFIDMQKLQGIGRSLDEMYDKGIKLHWNKTLDAVVYQGPYGAIGTTATYPGLFNNANIPETTVATGASGSTLWKNKTPGEILNDVNTLMVSTWAASQYDTTGMANHILIPPAQYAFIASQLISSAGSVSILTYLEQNNIGKSQGVDLKIFPSRWAIAAGTGTYAGEDVMLGYVNDEDRVYLDITVPIQRVMTTPNIADGGGAYLTLYAGQYGQVKFLYYQPCQVSAGV